MLVSLLAHQLVRETLVEGAHVGDAGQNVGARQPLFLPESDAKAIAPNAEPKPLGVARTVSQQVQVFGLAINDPVRIGSVALPVNQIAYPSIREPNLGSRAFAGMSLTVDWAHKRLQVARSAPSRS